MIANAPKTEIHLENIQANFAFANERCSANLMPVVKADAYGHGMIEVATALDGARSFAVARVTEGVRLRQHVANKPIVVLEGFLGEQECQLCVEYQLAPMVHSDYQLEILPKDLPFWLKFNTGMYRLGFQPEQAEALAETIPLKSLIGVSSHLANADQQNHPLNEVQLARFDHLTKYFPEKPRCFANSAAILNGMASDLDWVRPGIMLYGGSPSGAPLPELKPGMTLSAPIIALNHVKAGDEVGYGGLWRANKPARIAVVALGYADGYPREMPNGTTVLVNGQRRQLIGRVSMDMCTVLLDPADEVKPGDSVVFWGRGLPIDEIAASAGTISYTLMAGLGARVQRRYHGLEQDLGR